MVPVLVMVEKAVLPPKLIAPIKFNVPALEKLTLGVLAVASIVIDLVRFVPKLFFKFITPAEVFVIVTSPSVVVVVAFELNT